MSDEDVVYLDTVTDTETKVNPVLDKLVTKPTTRADTGPLLDPKRSGYFTPPPLPDTRKRSKSKEPIPEPEPTVSTVESVSETVPTLNINSLLKQKRLPPTEMAPIKTEQVSEFMKLLPGIVSQEGGDKSVNDLFREYLARLGVDDPYGELSFDEEEKKVTSKLKDKLDTGKEEGSDDTQSEAGSTVSTTVPTGLSSVFKHLSKSIKTSLDEEAMKDKDRVEKANVHLNAIRPSYVEQALRNDKVTREQTDTLAELVSAVQNLRTELQTIKTERRSVTQSLTEKVLSIVPNPEWSYPQRDAADNVYRDAVKAIQKGITIIEKNHSFKENGYNYLLEICSHSNAVSSNYGLSKEQQMTLILNCIPSTSTIYKELKAFNTLDQVFKFSSMTSSTIHTLTELEALIEAWHLNYSSPTALNDSISNLKGLIMDRSGKTPENVNQHALYNDMFTRVRREKLPAFVYRSLDESRIRLESETDPVHMHQTFLASLKPLLSYKQSARSHKLEVDTTANADTTEKDTVGNTQKDTGAKQKIARPQNNYRERARESKEQKGNQKEGNRYDRSKSRARWVAPWPKGKKYIISGSLTPELNNHFSEACYKCGMLKSHKARDCKIYQGTRMTMSLCSNCWCGFHEVCKRTYPPRQEQQGKPEGSFQRKKEGVGYGKGSKGVAAITESIVKQLRDYTTPPTINYYYSGTNGNPPPPPLAIKKDQSEEDSDD
jgi:hypothetical protein